ncbi:hypothetical protein FJZ48_01995, partial [Candidatus Uhrbacteria bacterium]|nr:hypothetical protein [Candidatus Uhrbacteria bacterium]
MKKNHVVWSVIIGLPLFIAVAPLIPSLVDHRMVAVLLVAAVFVPLFAIVRSWFDAGLSLVLAVYFFISWRLFPHTNDTTLLVRTAAIGSFVLLNVVLWI